MALIPLTCFRLENIAARRPRWRDYTEAVATPSRCLGSVDSPLQWKSETMANKARRRSRASTRLPVRHHQASRRDAPACKLTRRTRDDRYPSRGPSLGCPAIHRRASIYSQASPPLLRYICYFSASGIAQHPTCRQNAGGNGRNRQTQVTLLSCRAKASQPAPRASRHLRIRWLQRRQRSVDSAGQWGRGHRSHRHTTPLT